MRDVRKLRVDVKVEGKLIKSFEVPVRKPRVEASLRVEEVPESLPPGVKAPVRVVVRDSGSELPSLEYFLCPEANDPGSCLHIKLRSGGEASATFTYGVGKHRPVLMFGDRVIASAEFLIREAPISIVVEPAEELVLTYPEGGVLEFKVFESRSAPFTVEDVSADLDRIADAEISVTKFSVEGYSVLVEVKGIKEPVEEAVLRLRLTVRDASGKISEVEKEFRAVVRASKDFVENLTSRIEALSSKAKELAFSGELVSALLMAGEAVAVCDSAGPFIDCSTVRKLPESLLSETPVAVAYFAVSDALEQATGSVKKVLTQIARRLEATYREGIGKVADALRRSEESFRNGRFGEALVAAEEAVKACRELGVSGELVGRVEECSKAEKIRARIEAVKEFLESGIVIEVSSDAALVEGSPLVLEIIAHAPGSLYGPVEGVFVDFSVAREAGLSVRENRVKLPPIRPGGTVTARVEALPTKAGLLKVPLRICADNILCVTRSLELEVAPRPLEISGVRERVLVVDVSLADVYGFLRKPVSGFVKGYGCVEGYSLREVVLRPSIAPRGFEGSWTCCLLGCGGWGCAYLCRSGEREVVFKVPRGFEGIFEGGFVPTVHVKLLERIRDEAEILRRLKHPNVLRLMGVSKSVPLLAYEFAEGGSLDWQLSRGWTPSVRDILLIGIQVGDALRYIHSRGLIHGDIKPGNIFIKNGVAKVGDFSTLVKLVTRTSTHSRFGYTPGFRAPEQAYADVRRRAFELGIESRTDVYQLGNLLLYLLTGDSLDGEEAVRPGAVEEATEPVQDKTLRNLLMKTLNPEPAKRPSTEDVVKQLLKILMNAGSSSP